MKLRIKTEREHKGYLVRVWWDWIEVAYLVFGLRGLKAEIEFPSDWHEHRRAWVTLGFGLFTMAFSFPWKWVVPDHYQCSGPTYGFCFYTDLLFIRWGKDKGERGDPHTSFTMPWGWRHRLHELLSGPVDVPYTYTLRSGEVQQTTASMNIERRVWTRPWFPYKRERQYINVNFSEEVGEGRGSWKGGVLGCSYDMLPNETPLAALRRMEQERKFF